MKKNKKIVKLFTAPNPDVFIMFIGEFGGFVSSTI